MSTNSTPSSVYPLSAKGAAIPLDVARPINGVIETSGDVIYSIAGKAGKVVVLSVYCSNYAILEVRTAGALTGKFCMVPGTIYDLAVTAGPGGYIQVIDQGPDQDSVIVINEIERWSQLDNLNFGVS